MKSGGPEFKSTLMYMLSWSLGQCHSPPWLNFAVLKSNSTSVFDIGYSLTYECRPGYMTKKFNIICLENSKWSSVNDNICKRRSCATPADLLNGQMKITGLEFGSTIKYSCSEGYGGPFSILSPAIRCEPPPTISNGRYLSTKEYFHYGMVVSYECNTGRRGEKLYDLVGNKTLHCTSKDNKTGIWNSPPPRCITPAKCQTPVIAHGRRVSGFRRFYSLNDAVELECHFGFTMKGSKIVRCQSNSQWEPALPVCFRGCLPPMEIPHGKSNRTKDQFSFGEAVSYVCEPGYFLIGTASIECIEPGKWNYETPKCEVKSCGVFLDQLPNGRVVSPHRPQLGTKVFFVCDEGFWLNGSSSSTCVSGGGRVFWSDKMPICKRIICDSPPPPIINGRLPFLSENKFPYGTVLSYTCFKMFRMIGTKFIRCTSENQVNGVWSVPASRCEAYNRAAVCSEPKVLGRHLKLRSRPPYRHGDALKFVCDTNFTIKGYDTLWCQADNTWGPSPMPTCDSDCPSPPMIPNGQHRDGHSGPVASGLSVTYSCEPGYLLIGEKTIHCLPSGVWNATAPKCKEALCDPLIKFPNGQVEEPSHLRIGAVMTFSCNKGYHLRGHASSKCVLAPEGAVWTEIPICIGDPRNCKSRLSSSFHLGFLLDPVFPAKTVLGLVCKIVTESCSLHVSSSLAILCPPPPVIENGQHTGSSADDVPYGTKVIYKCNADPERGVKFNLIGESTIHCTSAREGHGIWSAAAPRCELSASSVQCLQPRVPNGYEISGQGPPYFYNASVVFRCNTGFSLKGSRQIRCSANGTWDPDVPICEKECPPPPQIPHGQHTGWERSHFAPGMCVDYTCDPGYLLLGNKSICCTPSGAWSLSAPQCEASCESIEEKLQLPSDGSPVVPVNSSCQEGYQLTGHVYKLCWNPEAGNRFWFQKIALCKAFHVVVNSLPFFFWGPAFQCLLSFFMTQNYPGMSVFYKCDLSYFLLGESFISCTNEGSWNKFVPCCKEVNCSLPEFIIGAQNVSTKKIYNFGAIFTLKCDEGYMLEGSPQSQCQEDQRWDPPLAVCKSRKYDIITPVTSDYIFCPLVLDCIRDALSFAERLTEGAVQFNEYMKVR
uniref:Sushi domain-containing protein n=1 Tax=Vombatus ursinus TaxID=29139 RepID=A0A4X2L3S5_VOMUR